LEDGSEEEPSWSLSRFLDLGGFLLLEVEVEVEASMLVDESVATTSLVVLVTGSGSAVVVEEVVVVVVVSAMCC